MLPDKFPVRMTAHRFSGVQSHYNNLYCNLIINILLYSLIHFEYIKNEIYKDFIFIKKAYSHTKRYPSVYCCAFFPV